MLKKFEDLLQKNGIRIPQSEFGRNHFDKKWKTVEQLFLKYHAELANCISQWKMYKSQLEADWQKPFPSLDQNGFTLEFRNPKEAEIIITKRRNQFKDLYKLYFEHDHNARKEWIDSIVKDAINKRYNYIVIRSKYSPAPEQLQFFYKSVADRKFVTAGTGDAVQWVAFPISFKGKCNIHTWKMSKASSFVSFN